MVTLRATLARFLLDEDGATAIEYGLIAALIAVGCILAMTSFGGGLSGLFNHVQSRSGNAMDGANI
jgi:pilus assembly protein Flp/PilA